MANSGPSPITQSTGFYRSAGHSDTESQAEKVNQASKIPGRPSESTETGKNLSERAEEGISVHKNPAPASSQPHPAKEESAEQLSDYTSAEKSELITVVHRRSLGERVIDKSKVLGSYLVAPLKLIATAVKLVAKPLQDYIVTPAYKGFIHLFQPEKDNFGKLEQKFAAEKAEHDQKRANRQAFEKACLDLAKKRYSKFHTQFACTELARRFGVTEREALDKVMSHEARAKANHLFNEQLARGSLELKKVFRDPKTDKQHYVTRTLTLATEKTRAGVVVSDQLLDKDSAEVARRLGNDPVLAEAMDRYNKEEAKYQKVMDKAARNDNAFAQQGPEDPGEPPRRPVHRCTDKHVIAAFKLQSVHYRNNLEAKVQTLIANIENFKTDFEKAYPEHPDTKDLIRSTLSSDEYSKKVYGRFSTIEANSRKLQNDIEEFINKGDMDRLMESHAELNNLNMEFDIDRRHKAIIDKMNELATVQKELQDLKDECSELQRDREEDIDDWKNGALAINPDNPDQKNRVSGTRDRLDIGRLKGWVYKDAKGNDLDIFTRDDDRWVTGVDRDKYAQVNDIVIPAPDKKLAPIYNGVKMPGLAYEVQQGMKWSKMDPARHGVEVQSYVAQRDSVGDLREDRNGNILWEESSDQPNNHWAVKDSEINGRHEGYDKRTIVVKNGSSANSHHRSVRGSRYDEFRDIVSSVRGHISLMNKLVDGNTGSFMNESVDGSIGTLV